MRPRLIFPLLLAALSLAQSFCRAADDLGATPHAGFTTFRVWAPFVDSVAVRVNDQTPVPLAIDPGHPDRADAIWSADMIGAKPGDRYRYVIRCNGQAREFNDPRALRLTSPFESAWSVIVDPGRALPAFDEPALNNTVIYEIHVGSFHADASSGRFNFAGAAQKLDYLKDLGINAVEVMPINENSRPRGHVPPDFDWGYDPLQYYAVKSAYGTPEDFKDFVARCHERGIEVILDVVYNHVTAGTLLEKFGGYSAPGLEDGIYFYGASGRTPWGPRPDFSRRQVRDYVQDNVRLWLADFGVDGLRWDSVSNIRAFEGRRDFNRAANPDGIELMRRSNHEFPDKLMIAEDLRGAGVVTAPIAEGGLGFNSQWDNNFCGDVRKAVSAAANNGGEIAPLAATIARKIGQDPFARVIYSEDHDQVGHPQDRTGGKPQIRVPAIIDRRDPQSLLARQLSNVAAVIVLTSPGVPMLFQGQEMLDARTFEFGGAAPLEWNRVDSFNGVVRFYRDLIMLRRNIAGATAGLSGPHTQIIHIDEHNHTLAYRRWQNGGPRDDCIVVVNLSDSPMSELRIGFPRPGKWIVRLNSNSNRYDYLSQAAYPTEINATRSPADGMECSSRVTPGPYGVLILSQD